jgi:hypothetical protein
VWYSVLRSGIPLGTVELPATELATGLLQPLPAYASVAHTVRVASTALLRFGLYGPPVSAKPDPSRRAARRALWAAATLRLELAELASGAPVPTLFLNLVEAPADGGVVVVARFLDIPARVSAPLPSAAVPGRDHGETAA